MTYFGKPSLSIARKLKESDLNIRFKTSNKFSNFIKNNKSKTLKDNKLGVYKLICGTDGCDMVYAGQTGRNFKERIREHFRSYFNQEDTSNYANHLIENTHKFDKEYKVLHQAQKGEKLNFIRSSRN